MVVKRLDVMGGENIFRVRAGDPNRNVIVEVMAQAGRRSVMTWPIPMKILLPSPRVMRRGASPRSTRGRSAGTSTARLRFFFSISARADSVTSSMLCSLALFSDLTDEHVGVIAGGKARNIIAGECRFMKHSKVWALPTVRRVAIREKTKTGEYLVVDDARALQQTLTLAAAVVPRLGTHQSVKRGGIEAEQAPVSGLFLLHHLQGGQQPVHRLNQVVGRVGGQGVVQEPAGLDALADQVIAYGVGATQGQGVVVLLCSFRVRVPFDDDVDVMILLERGCRLFENRHGVRPDVGLVEVEVDTA
mgnify:CR=1 FL=1